MPTIEIYTQPFCPFCARALKLLTSKGVAFHEIEAPSGSPARQTVRTRSGGRSSVPQVFVDDKLIGGSDDLAALERAGKLDAVLAG